MFNMPLDESAELEELIEAYSLSAQNDEYEDNDDKTTKHADLEGSSYESLEGSYLSYASYEKESDTDQSYYGELGCKNLKLSLDGFKNDNLNNAFRHRSEKQNNFIGETDDQSNYVKGIDCSLEDDNEDDFVEVDPTNRYGRYSQLLGKGSVKQVYRGFDKEEGIEVAWNQVDLSSFHYIENEVHFLETLRHKNIIKIYTFWVDRKRNKVNFITELCTNTLLGFRRQHRHVCMKAVKDWARQILRALVYLHSQNPPVIHGDLKCENIFVNCSNGKIKVGDFGSAVLMDENRYLHQACGTPVFMAPEMYAMQDYNELVDVYAFGMCMIELLTLETPYSESRSLAETYEKVINGVKPKALDRIKDVEAIRFILRCLAPVLQRPSAAELLSDPFLLPEGQGQPSVNNKVELANLMKSASSPNLARLSSMPSDVMKMKKKKLSTHASFNKNRSHREMEVIGEWENESMFWMHLRIVQPNEHVPVRTVKFPFDSNSDTPQGVADEMVQELHFPESDSVVIADLIASVIESLKQRMEEVLVESVSNPVFGSQMPNCLKAIA